MDIKKVGRIQKVLAPLTDGNWSNATMGQIEELSNSLEKIGDLLTFTLAVLIENQTIDIDIMREEYSEGWKIDY